MHIDDGREREKIASIPSDGIDQFSSAAVEIEEAAIEVKVLTFNFSLRSSLFFS